MSATTYCGYCTKSYKDMTKLKKHTKKVHSGYSTKAVDMEKGLCVHCHQSFQYSAKNTFLRHILSCYLNPLRKWFAGAPFYCHHCQAKKLKVKFSRKDNLARHLREKHGKQPDSSQKEKSVEEIANDFIIRKIYELIDGKLDPTLLIDFTKNETKEVIRLKLHGTKTQFRFTELCRTLALHGFFLECLAAIFDYLINVKEIRDNYLLAVSLESASDLDYPIPMPLQKANEWKLENFLNQIEITMQSRTSLGLSSDVQLNVVSMPDPLNAAGGYYLNPKQFYALEDFLARKSDLLDVRKIQTETNSNTCVALCIAVRVYETTPDIKRASWYKNRHKRKLPLAIEGLVKEIYSTIEKDYNSAIEPTIGNFEKIQKWLSVYNLKVYKVIGEKISESVLIFDGNVGNRVANISLLLYKQHCFLICSEKILRNKRSISDKTQNSSCKFCHSESCTLLYPNMDDLRRLKCDQCMRFFKNDYCFGLHKSLETCQKYSRCLNCFKSMETVKLNMHACGLHRCRNCSEFVTEDHKCFVQPIFPTKDKKRQAFIFFDIESMVIDGKHCPNVVVLYRCCEKCMDDQNNMEPICCFGGNRRHVYVGAKCIDDSVEFMFFHPSNAGAICIAHYGSGYDFHFILSALLERNHMPKKILCRDLRLISMTVGRSCILKDSYLWFRCKLRDLSDLWCVDARKYYFNHKWNSREHLNYVGPWPSIEEFDVASCDHADFLQWYNKSKAERPTYHLLDELVKYCEADVDLLYKSCMKFRRMVLDNDYVDPLVVSVSIASLTSYVFRTKYLLADTLPLILDKNVSAIALKQQSNLALLYLSWLSSTLYPNLKYAGNGPEVGVGYYKLDGYDDNTNTIFEVFGCMVHGCPLHTDSTARHPFHTHLTNNDVFEKSMSKIEDLESQNYTVKVVWEHEINETLKRNEGMQEFFGERKKWRDVQEPINARDALHGGRVEAFVLLAELTEEMITRGYRIKYLDIVSLYPYVQRTKRFPISHPIIYNSFELKNNGNFWTAEDFEPFFGVASVICYGPEDLLIPVLPVKNPKTLRLTFPVCGPCSLNINQSHICDHKGEERSFDGTFTTPELLKAIEMGYTIVKVRQIWHFEKSSSTLFEEYMNNYAKHKYASSGWPECCDTEEKKQQYLTQLKEREHINLNPEDINKNVAQRTWSKSFLTNLWGKLTTRLDKIARKVEFIRNEKDYLNIVLDKKRQLVSIDAVTEDYAIVETLMNDEFHYSSFHNPVIAAFVCSYGRLQLLEYLLKAREHAIYCDTDSIVYWTNVNESDPLQPYLGSYFGQLKNELSDGSEYITKWISLGSKNYAYETANGNVVHKTKGLVVHSAVANQFNFDLLKGILLKDSKTIADFYDNLEDRNLAEKLQMEMFQKFGQQCGVLLPQPTITRNFKKLQQICNQNERTKFLRFNFNKRKLVDKRIRPDVVDEPSFIAIRSIPWGYCEK